MEEVEVKDVREKSLSERVLYWEGDEEREEEKRKRQEELGRIVEKHEGFKLNEVEKKDGVLENTRLAMTSRTAFFNGEQGTFLENCDSHETLIPRPFLHQIASSPLLW